MLLNALFNSLSYAYGYNSYLMNSFLFSASDLYGDLIKFSISFMDSKEIHDISNWSKLYQNYYLHNHYGGIESLEKGLLSNLGTTPFYLYIAYFIKFIIFKLSPSDTIIYFYIFIFLSIVFMVYYFYSSYKKTFIISLFIFCSYPTLFMLTRGHIYSYITALFLIFFIALIIKQSKNYLLVALLLAIAVSFRPNVAILSVLFFLYGFRDGVKYLVIFIFLSLVLFIINIYLASFLYPDYNLTNFIHATDIYFHTYVLGSAGSEFNNSLYGGINFILNIFDIKVLNSELKMINMASFIILIFILSISILLTLKKYISSFDFSFIVVSIYILASSVFATYHLFVLYIFLLLYKNIDSNNYRLIIFTTIFMLSPKNYYHINNVSIETLLNPLVLFASVLYMILKVLKNKRNILYEKN